MSFCREAGHATALAARQCISHISDGGTLDRLRWPQLSLDHRYNCGSTTDELELLVEDVMERVVEQVSGGRRGET